MNIRLTIDGTSIETTLIDSAPSRDLAAMLPLTVTFSDYAGTEKVGDLPGRLSTQGAPAGVDPDIGDLTYYAPWGNLAIFYQDFGYADGLIKLGTFMSGIDTLANKRGDFTATLELVA